MSNPWKMLKAPVVLNLSEIMLEQYKKGDKRNEDIAKQITGQCASASVNMSKPKNESSKTALENSKTAHKGNALKTEVSTKIVDELPDSSDIVRSVHDSDDEQSEDESIVSDLDENIEDYVCLPKGYLTRGEEAIKKESVVKWKELNSVFDELQEKIRSHIELKYAKEIRREITWWYYTYEQKKSEILDKLTSPYQLDVPTRFIFFRLFTNGVLEDINKVITTGSKCVTIYANGNTLCTKHVVPKECVVKVFTGKIKKHYTNNLYNNDRFSMPQKVVACKWAENEKETIVKMHKVSLNCPEIVCLKKNVLVVTFVGKNQKSAPTLEEVKLDSEGWQRVYDEIVEALYKLYNSARMVLDDFNPHNVLWWENKCWFVDVSQAVTTEHFYCTKYVFNYCDSIFNFFESKATDVMTTTQLYKYITGLDEVCDDRTKWEWK